MITYSNAQSTGWDKLFTATNALSEGPAQPSCFLFSWCRFLSSLLSPSPGLWLSIPYLTFLSQPFYFLLPHILFLTTSFPKFATTETWNILTVYYRDWMEFAFPCSYFVRKWDECFIFLPQKQNKIKWLLTYLWLQLICFQCGSVALDKKKSLLLHLGVSPI